MMIAVQRLARLTSGVLLHNLDQFGLHGAVHLVDLVVHGEHLTRRAWRRPRAATARRLRIITPTFSGPWCGMSTGSEICG